MERVVVGETEAFGVPQFWIALLLILLPNRFEIGLDNRWYLTLDKVSAFQPLWFLHRVNRELKGLL